MRGCGALLVVPFIIVCIVVVCILGWYIVEGLQEHGPQAAPEYFPGAEVPRNHPYYQLHPIIRLIPAAGAAIIIAIVVASLLPRG